MSRPNYTEGKATLIIKGLTMEQAKMFTSWYEGQGEQDASIWFEENRVSTPYANVFKKDEIDESTQTITSYMHTPPQD